jgi:F-type H+-transporting ATPase subunit delta
MTASIARRYAKAVFALAQEDRSLEETGEELQRLAAVASVPDLAPVLANPLLSSASRRAIARTLAERLALRRTTTNFLQLLADHRRLDQLAGIADHYRKLVDRALGRVRAQISAATPLTPDQQQRLVDALAALTGKSVLPEWATDAQLLGGVVVEIESKVYDGSVRTQLERLATSIAGGRSVL